MAQDPSSAQTQAEEAVPRFRAAKACRRCHEKRVKCDASERGTPCTRCEQRQEPECTLIQSRRGLYSRPARRQARQAKQTSIGTVTGTGISTGTATVEQEVQVHGDQTRSRTGLDATEVMSASPLNAVVAVTPSETIPQRPQDGTSPSAERDYPEGTPRTPATMNGCSYREISWAATFDHLLEHHHSGGNVLDKHSITYIGEAFPLGLVLKDLRGGTDRPPLHHPAPPTVDDAADSPRISHPPGMRPEEIAFLEAKEAFTAPSDEALDNLMQVFFERVFPLYPIVNPQELLAQHKARRIPWMLLHAICLISATYCPIVVLHSAGFKSRPQARSLFYGKAKALFDIGYEGNKIVALQVCIIMSFWGGGPSNYWNFYTWICTGVTIAETLGFHRSMARANIEQHDRSLIKRLWWVLIIRDAFCASLVGRPFRINLDHCDIDTLIEGDFFYGPISSLNSMQIPQTQSSGAYQIHATRLSLILRHIVAARFYPHKEFTALGLQQMLIDWRSNLPSELQWADQASSHANIFVSTLCVLYNHNVILANVNNHMDPLSVDTEGASLSALFGEDIASDAAQQIASSSCSVVTAFDGLLPPHELFHGLFIASVVFYMQTKSQDRTTARLGMSGLTNCKMALHASRETWDASPWISQLFDKVLRISVVESQPTAEGLIDTAREFGPNDVTTLDLNGFSLPMHDEWPSHLFFGNMFEHVVSDEPSTSCSATHIPWA